MLFPNIPKTIVLLSKCPCRLLTCNGTRPVQTRLVSISDRVAWSRHGTARTLKAKENYIIQAQYTIWLVYRTCNQKLLYIMVASRTTAHHTVNCVCISMTAMHVKWHKHTSASVPASCVFIKKITAFNSCVCATAHTCTHTHTKRTGNSLFHTS